MLLHILCTLLAKAITPLLITLAELREKRDHEQ